MSRSPLADAFGHHVWATLKLIDACLPLSADQLATSLPGTYGSVLDTMRHIVGADAGYLHVQTGGRVALIDADTMDLEELRGVMTSHGPAWSELLASDPDPDEVLERRRDDGSVTRATRGVRMAQAVHHGTDHRSQVCTALTGLGIEPPDIDVWSYGAEAGSVSQDPAPA